MEAMDVLNSENVDLIFLDIQMPGLTGIEFLKTLRKKPMVIFTTAYPEYALEGYSLDVIDYLLKPITFERFVQSVNKASELFKLKNNNGDKTPYAPDVTTRSENHIQIKSGSKTYRIKTSEIFYIEGLREYVTYVLENQKIISLESLRNLELNLPANQFLRVHKSFIINKEKVESLEGNQVEIKGRRIPIGKSYKEAVIKQIFN